MSESQVRERDVSWFVLSPSPGTPTVRLTVRYRETKGEYAVVTRICLSHKSEVLIK